MVKSSVDKNLRFKTPKLRSDLRDYSDAYIAVKKRVSVRGTNSANRRNKKLTFKNNAPFRSCLWKINDTFIDYVEDLNIVMPMHNLLEYSENYCLLRVWLNGFGFVIHNKVLNFHDCILCYHEPFHNNVKWFIPLKIQSCEMYLTWIC